MSQSKFFRDRVTSCLEVGRRVVLLYTFHCAIPNKPSTECFDRYLQNLPSTTPINYCQKKGKLKFTATEKQQIQDYPSCDGFDISLLCNCIVMAGENVAAYNSPMWSTPSKELEYCLTTFRKERNDSAHGKREITENDFSTTAKRLRDLFCDTLGATKERYNRPDTELASKTQEVVNELDNIALEVLGEKDLLAYCGPQLKKDFFEKVSQVLNKQLHNTRYIDPLSFLTGTNLSLQVQRVFTELRVSQGKSRGVGRHLKYFDLISVARSGSGSTHPQVLLVEGVAGSGKTTSTTLVCDEWCKIKNGQHSILTGLDYYDLVLRVQCCEEKITSLCGLLETHVSSVFLKYRKLFLPLIKEGKVLLLLDGYDEATEDSKLLVDDILREMKTIQGFTLLCTSRPESVAAFHSKIPREYRVTYIELLGIHQSDRPLFIRRYHEEIMKHTGDNTQNTDDLLEKVQKVLKREQFRLPLNMVILTWVYLHNPAAVTPTTTQTELYYSTFLLSFKKQMERASHKTKLNDRKTLENCLNKAVRKVQYESLLALWHMQLIFEEEAVDRIKATCNINGLSSKEVLSAYLSLRATWTHMGVLEQYLAPHKGWLEFLAALYIASHPSLNYASGSIRNVLQTALTIEKLQVPRLQNTRLLEALESYLPWFQNVLQIFLGPWDLQLPRLQNVLHHVAGLLPLLHDTVPQSIAEEVVDLLQESGVSSREQWLDLLEDTKAIAAVLHRVAHHFPTDPHSGELVVTDSRVESYKVLLPHLPPSRVILSFLRDPTGLGDLLQALAHHSCVELHLNHHYQHPCSTDASDHLLKQFLQRSNLEVFKGHLTDQGVDQLPSSLKELHLSLESDQHSGCLLPALHIALQKLPQLQKLRIHVRVDSVTPAALSALPDPAAGEGNIELFMSGVGEQQVEQACQVAKALQSPSGYWSIMFPRGSAAAAGWEKLLEGLARDEVRVSGMVNVPDTILSLEQESQLFTIANNTLGCYFGRCDDDVLWQ